MIKINISITSEEITGIIDDLCSYSKNELSISIVTKEFLNKIIRRSLLKSEELLDEAEEIYDICNIFNAEQEKTKTNQDDTEQLKYNITKYLEKESIIS